MRYSEFATFLQDIENTPKRLEITEIISDLFKKLDPNEIDKALYLALGYLKAPFETPKFNLAEKMLIKAVAEAYKLDEKKVTKHFKDAGDLGTATQKLSNHLTTKQLSIIEVHTSLLSIANISGTGSQEKKLTKTAELLNKLDPLSAKFVIRTILGTLRLGFTELTVIDGIALTLIEEEKSKKKTVKTYIEHKYNIHPDIGMIAKAIKTSGLPGIDAIKMKPGIPIKAQAASRVKDMQEAVDRIHKLWAEYKLDGTRVLLHMDKRQTSSNVTQNSLFNTNNNYLLKTFTRNLENTSHMYPDILNAASKQLDANSVILDGEAIGFDPKTGTYLPFQETIQRKRKHGVGDKITEIPLKYIVFDILYKDGQELITKPLAERKDILQKTIKKGDVIEVNAYVEAENLKDLLKVFKESNDKNLEGLIVKNPNDPYQAGARSYSWIKLKHADEKLLEDAIDCVVLGYYVGKGVRNKFGIGGFLAGVVDKTDNTIKTITKVGTGLTDDNLTKLKAHLDKIAITNPLPDMKINKKFLPDVYVKPEFIVEIGADEISKSKEHSAGYALRFPRLLRFRTDKNLSESTDLKQVIQMFQKQVDKGK